MNGLGWVTFKVANLLFGLPLMVVGMALQMIGQEVHSLGDGLSAMFHEWFAPAPPEAE